MRRMIVVAAITTGVIAAWGGPASSGPDRGPEQSGAVTRFSEPGLQGLFDPAVRMEGGDVPLVALLNIAAPADLCTFTLAGDGDLMVVETPSGHRNFVLHDDVPVLIFDVTGLGSVVTEVFPNLIGAACGPTALQPIATGTAHVRNNVQFNGSTGTFQQILDAAGSAADGSATWSVSLHRRARGEIPGPPAPEDINDSITLARHGR